MKRRGQAHAISSDVRFRHPAFHSLDGNIASPSQTALCFQRRSIGMGSAPHPLHFKQEPAMNEHHSLRLLISLAATVLLVAPTVNADGLPGVDRGVTAAEITAARDRGLDWLVAAQREDGSWGSGGFRGSAAVTAQGLLALLGSGSTPRAGPHALAAGRAVDFLQACYQANGLIAGNEAAAHGPMYGHAFATLALAECLGEQPARELRPQLVAAAGLIERSQAAAGGWRYQPRPQEGDVSVTAAMLVAIRALAVARVPVNQKLAERAVGFLEQLQNEDGGFRYLANPGPSAPPRTAAALFALQLAGVRGAVIERGFAWLDQQPLTEGSDDGYRMYGLAYAAAARWQRRLATSDTAAWDRWFDRVARLLLAEQQADGSWADPSCREYGTAAAVSVLQTPAGLLPIVAAEGEAAGVAGQ